MWGPKPTQPHCSPMALKRFFARSPAAHKAQPVLGDRRLACWAGAGKARADG